MGGVVRVGPGTQDPESPLLNSLPVAEKCIQNAPPALSTQVQTILTTMPSKDSPSLSLNYLSRNGGGYHSSSGDSGEKFTKHFSSMVFVKNQIHVAIF